MRIFFKFIEIFLGRKIEIPDDISFSYLLSIFFDCFFALIRSVRYLPFGGIRYGRFLCGKGVRIRSCSSVWIKSGVRLGDFVYLDGYSKYGLHLGKGVSIGAYSRLICSGSISSKGEFIKIGDGVGIGEFSRIGGSGGVEIGSDTIIAQYFSAHPENHNFLDKSRLIRQQGTKKAKITIGSNCWIGAKVTITAGVTVGRGVVIGSGSVVNRDLPDYCIAAGVPARVIRMY